MRKLLKLVAIFVLAASGQTAHAAWTDTFTDLGVVYTITDLTVGPALTHSYSLVVDTTGYNAHADPSYLDSVNLKAWSANSANMFSVLTSAPGGFAVWSTSEQPITANGCGGGSAGFACFEALSKGQLYNNVDTAGVKTFLFNVTVSSSAGTASFLNSGVGAHVGAGYASVTGAGASYGTTSHVGVTPIPEPEIYAMLAAGLGLMGFVARRRKQQLAAG